MTNEEKKKELKRILATLGALGVITSVSYPFINQLFEAKKENENFSLENYIEQIIESGKLSPDFKFDSNKSIVKPIEKIEENDIVSYKIEKDYTPYQIDNMYSYAVAGAIKEENDYYVVTPYEGNFEGCVAIYLPYWHLLNEKNIILEEKNSESTKTTIEEIERYITDYYYEETENRSR